MEFTVKFNVAGRELSDKYFSNVDKIKELIDSYVKNIKYASIQVVSYNTIEDMGIHPEYICGEIKFVDHDNKECVIETKDEYPFALTEDYAKIGHITFDTLSGVDDTDINRYAVVKIIRARFSTRK